LTILLSIHEEKWKETNLLILSNIPIVITDAFIRVIKSRGIRWAGHVALRGRGEACTGGWWGNLRETDNLEHSGVGGRIILRWIFRKWDVGLWGLDRAGSL
jgi:hypothetical protein